MGFNGAFISISDKIPREDVWSQPEAGRARAEEAMRQIAGDQYVYVEQGEFYDYQRGWSVWVGNWGNTTIMCCDTEMFSDDISMPEGYGRWDIALHSTVDYALFSVKGGPHGDRRVELYPDMEWTFEESISGSPLPFEQPNLQGEHSMHEEGLSDDEQYPLPFHPLEYGQAGFIWALGLEAETPMDDEVIEPLLNDPRLRQTHVMHMFTHRDHI